MRLVTVCTGARYDQSWDTHRDHFPLLKRSLAIQEKFRGPKAPELAASLDTYAALLGKMHRKDEATEMEARAKAIRTEQSNARLLKGDK